MGVELAYTDAVARATSGLYAKVAQVIPEIEWPVHAPSDRRDQPPEARKERRHPGAQLHDAGDLPLRRRFRRRQPGAGARSGRAPTPKIIVQAGVHFMAETSKILSPEKTVLIPDREGRLLAGRLDHRRRCAAAEQKYPGLPVVTYVNTSAEVKAESDICCTSGNAVEVVEDIAREFGTDTVIMIPDEYLAQNVAGQDRRQGHHLGRRLRSA